MKRTGVVAAFLAAALVIAPTATAEPAAVHDRVWAVAATRLAELADTSPSTYPFGATGRSPYQRTSAYAWTSGFLPASLWLMYEHTHDRAWLARARHYTAGVLPVARWTGTHDLGFMVGLPAQLGMRLDPSASRRDAYRDAVVTAARSLSSRWDRQVGAIRSGEYGGRWGLIIDSAMNAPLLIEVGAMVGGAEGARLSERGLQHMLTLSRYFIRPDGSTAHRLAFDPRTGALLGPVPGQGLSSTSTWARGQAWAINGFAQAFALTRDSRLLDAARRTADYWLAHVASGSVPAWDLDITDDAAPRDSSAAAIAADGLLELGQADPDATRAAVYSDAARQLLVTLSAPRWVPSRAGARGVLQHQAYNIPADRREGTYAWGDAYLLLSMSRSG